MRRILHTGDYYYVRESYQSNNTQSLQTSEKYSTGRSWLSRIFVGIIFYTREVLLTSHYEERLFDHASQPRVAGTDIRLLSYWKI